MTVSMSPKQKVYQGVLQEIRLFIDNNNLQPGDKLPSERELSDKLLAGRSSVREALRALELLGLIETRHGEGTYLSAYRSFQTVELLSSFILQKGSTRNDLFLTKRILEKEVAKQAFHHIGKNDSDKLNLLINNSTIEPNDKHVAFFRYLFEKIDNLLLEKIWQLMEEFAHTINKRYYYKRFYADLIQLYATKRYDAIEALFEDLTLSDEN